MSAAARRPDPGRWGVQTEYVDAGGTRRTVPQRSVRAVLEALGADGPGPPGELGPSRRAGPVTRCHPAPDLAWGWAAQLYALRSRASWGMGDLGDLAALGGWTRRLGGSMVMLNPLHAPLPRLPQEASPYFPSSRLFRNPLYIRVPDVPGARGDPVVQRHEAKARELNGAPVIDRDRVHFFKMKALVHLWEEFRGDRRFDAYCIEEGEALLRYATFCVIAERQRKPWRQWPVALQSPDSAVRRLAERERRRIDFHRWLQWHLDLQLAKAARRVPLVHDLAVGTSPHGADAWMWQDTMAFGARVGAPPDEFTPGGQDWGLVPFDPHRLRAAGYRPFAQMLRRVLRHGGGVRIDHVMGLFRLWWIPEGAPDARGGAYVRYPWRELLEVVAEESRRAKAYVVGEDLGTVERGVRAQLRRRGVLSYRVLWFEREQPPRYPLEAMAAMTTHDLPTVGGVWTRADLAELAASGRPVNRAAEEGLRTRLRRLTALSDDAPVATVVERAYRGLAAAPSKLIAVTLDDATLATRRPNLPGATGRENWAIPLPRTLEQLRRDELPRRLAAAVSRR